MFFFVRLAGNRDGIEFKTCVSLQNHEGAEMVYNGIHVFLCRARLEQMWYRIKTCFTLQSLE